MEKNGIDIKSEQKKVREKIQAIEDAGIFGRVEEILLAFGGTNFKSPNKELLGRVKKADSACEKIERQGLPASQMHDLVGFMFIVDLPEEYLSAKDVLQLGMPDDSYIHDFDGSIPENNGYSSFHMGVNKDRLEGAAKETDPQLLDGLSIEIQLKSMGMFIAQEATHDSIYKNPDLSQEEKDEAQTVMFPLIERIVNAQKYQDYLDKTARSEQDKKEYYTEMILRENQEIKKLKEDNKEFIEQKPELVSEIFCEYIVAQYSQMIKKEPFLHDEVAESKDIQTYCRDAIQVLLPSIEGIGFTDTQPTGFGNIDNIYSQIMSFPVSKLHEMSIKRKEQEAVPPILEGAIKTSGEVVSSQDIKTMSGTIVREQELKYRDAKIDIEQEDRNV